MPSRFFEKPHPLPDVPFRVTISSYYLEIFFTPTLYAQKNNIAYAMRDLILWGVRRNDILKSVVNNFIMSSNGAFQLSISLYHTLLFQIELLKQFRCCSDSVSTILQDWLSLIDRCVKEFLQAEQAELKELNKALTK